jgi:hypothetical protein
MNVHLSHLSALYIGLTDIARDNDRIFLRNFYPDTQNPVTQDNPIVPRMIPEIPQIVPLCPRTFRSPKMNHGSGKYNNLPRKELHT